MKRAAFWEFTMLWCLPHSEDCTDEYRVGLPLPYDLSGFMVTDIMKAMYILAII